MTKDELRRRLKAIDLTPRLARNMCTGPARLYRNVNELLTQYESSNDEDQADWQPDVKKNDGRAERTGQETERYFKTANDIFDEGFDMPPAFKLVWLCLHRCANNRKIPRSVDKISHEWIAAACFLDRRAVAQAVRYLAAIEAIEIYRRGGFTRDGQRMTFVYYVPPVSSLNYARLKRNITRVRREQSEMLLLRRDQARMRERAAA